MSNANADLESRLTGTLLGTALGDALGLPAEQLSAEAVTRRFADLDRFHLLGKTGYVSDDTEQAALVAQSLLRCPEDPAGCTKAFRQSLLGWFSRLPWGIGAATLRACLRIAVGLPRSGVPSAGNGAAMRAAILGVYFHDDLEARVQFGRALAEVTHTDSRAVEGALFVAEVAAYLASTEAPLARPEFRRFFETTTSVVYDTSLRDALKLATVLALSRDKIPSEAARELGTSGFVLHSVPRALFCFLRHSDDPQEALRTAIRAGGDTDTTAAIVGAWLGALHGEAGLPGLLIGKLHDGPFGPSHLRDLGRALAARRRGETLARTPGYSIAAALIRNLLLIPVITAHGFRRMLL